MLLGWWVEGVTEDRMFSLCVRVGVIIAHIHIAHMCTHNLLTAQTKIIMQICLFFRIVLNHFYKILLYLINTTLIYKYNLHIIVKNKKVFIINLVLHE